MIVLAAYNIDCIPSAIALCEGIAEALQIDTRIMVLNNPNIVLSTLTVPKGWLVLRGSNRNHEFSAWQEALDSYRANVASQPLFVFANDTIGKKCSEYKNIDLLSFLGRTAAIGESEAVGFVAPFDQGQSLSILGKSCSRRMCTALFAVAGPLLRRIESQIDHYEALGALLRCSYSPNELLSPTAAPCLQAHLHRWLLEGGWHSASKLPMSPDEFQRLRAKALCILNEIYLSVIFEGVGGRLVPLVPFARLPYFHRITRLACRFQTLRQNPQLWVPARVVRLTRALKKWVVH